MNVSNVSAASDTATTIATVSIIGGTLSMEKPEISDIYSPYQDGKYVGFISDFTVTDYRGTGQGWSVYSTASITDENGNEVPADVYLSSITSVERMNNNHGDIVLPTVAEGKIHLSSSPTAIATAEIGTGMGEYKFELPYKGLKIDMLNAKKGNYKLNVNWFVTEGP